MHHLTLTFMQREEKWKHVMAEPGGDAKIPDLWSLSQGSLGADSGAVGRTRRRLPDPQSKCDFVLEARGENADTSGPMDVSSVHRNGEEDAGDVDSVRKKTELLQICHIVFREGVSTEGQRRRQGQACKDGGKQSAGKTGSHKKEEIQHIPEAYADGGCQAQCWRCGRVGRNAGECTCPGEVTKVGEEG